ncbi:glycoside hydrolase family 31 protein [Deinococcus roseus]|uniref:Alpha-glucosidase n=1 Tax=Deinococcus roseus TaxID=392414 RepID=A0ABQ2DEC4_9DEIO|nr:TIM-barrel domain-containing protein [Deinococcus roseus]GGJ54441.1 hypothetical protein GCM10008938_45670 [Deinococcus roseus]
MFNRIEVNNRLIQLSGLHSRAEISHPAPEIWRFRIRPRGYLRGETLPEKRSMAVLPLEHLEFQSDPESWLFSTAESSLQVFRNGSVQVRHKGAEVVFIEGIQGEFQPAVPVNRQRTSVTLQASLGEAYLGFGEKVGPLNKRGMKFTFWNTDVQPHHPDTDPLYQSIPFFMGIREGKAWGFFLDESARSTVDVAKNHPERIVWTAESGELDLYFVLGDTPADILKSYTTLTGRTPLPPLWSLGLHQSRYSYETAEEVQEVIQSYRSHQIPLDAIHLDIHHMDAYKVFTFDRHRFPEPKTLSDWAAGHGVKLITIMDPGIKKEARYPMYEEAAAQDFLVKTDRGDVFVGEVWPDPAVFPDFTREDVQKWWGQKHAGMLESGIAGFWNDMNEPSCFSCHSPVDPALRFGNTLPDDVRHGNMRHLEAHNLYALGMCKSTFEGLKTLQPEKRPFIVTRAGYAGIQRYSAVWTGDNSAHWEHMEMNLQLLLSLGLSGVPFVGSDLGGFLSNASGELVTRWTWLGAFFPFMRNHSSIGTDYQEPWAFPEHLPHIRSAIQFRYRLLPYLYTLMKEAEETGLPPMRAISLHHPEHQNHLSDQFLFGESLLVAPILRPYHTHRSVLFPSAGWMDFAAEDSQQHDAGYGLVSAGLDRIPVFLKPGGIVPLTDPASSTSTAFWDTLEWHVHVGSEGEFVLYEDEGEGNQPGIRTTVRIEHLAGRVRITRAGRQRSSEVLWVYGLDAAGPVKLDWTADEVLLESGVSEQQLDLVQ